MIELCWSIGKAVERIRTLSDFPFQENILVSGRSLPHLEHHSAEHHSADLHLTAPSVSLRLANDGVASSLAKRKSPEEEEVTVHKQVCHSSSTPSTSSSLLQGNTELEAELLSRLQQEDEDRRLALLLQKELDQEERQRATDRRKGSTDAYPLRQHRPGKEEASRSAVTPSRAFKKTTKTSSSSSSSSSSFSSSSASSSASTSSIRGSKQATLTEMFSGLNRWTLSLYCLSVSLHHHWAQVGGCRHFFFFVWNKSSLFYFERI